MSPHFKSYQQDVLHLISHLQDFNIIFVPIMCNVATDAMANATARMSPLREGFSIEIIYKPSILIISLIYTFFMTTKRYCILW